MGSLEVLSSVVNSILSYIECDRQIKDYLLSYSVMGISQGLLIDGHTEKELKVIETSNSDIYIKGVNEKILAKKVPSEKADKTKTVQNNKSPVGSRKVTLPTVGGR